MAKQLNIYTDAFHGQSQALVSNRLINSLKLFFDVVVEFEFIGARQSATTGHNEINTFPSHWSSSTFNK